MRRTAVWRRGILLAVLVLVTGGIWLDLAAYERPTHYLEVHFLDVGQGDATFIETPDGVQVLIDGGREAGVLRTLAKEMSFFDRHIDVVIATHPDADHIGGLIDVLKRYEVELIVVTENKSETPTADAFFKAVEAEGAQVVYARKGASLALGASTTLTVLFPDRNPVEFESNASSIVTQLRYGDTEFMLTGDAPQSIEEYLVHTFGTALKSDVLKVGHHGSDTSTAEAFLLAVDPDIAVISAGKDNSYGHPHEEVVDRLRAHGVSMLETAAVGTVSLVSDGVRVWQE